MIAAERRLKDGLVHPSPESIVFQEIVNYPER